MSSIKEETSVSGHILTKNTIYNFAGHVVPLLAAIFAIPIIIKGIGTEKFGVLILAWAVIGYFSLFDLRIGRSTTKFVAEYIGSNRSQDIPILIRSSMMLLLLLGVIGGVVVFSIVPWIISSFLNIPESMMAESKYSFYFLSISIPFVIVSAGMRGVLEANQRFALINSITIPSSLLNYVAPAIVSVFTRDLSVIIGILVLSRILVSCVFFLFSAKYFVNKNVKRFYKKKLMIMLLKFGSWMSVSSIIGPIMVYFDKFFIASMASVSDVTFYATPYSVLVKLWIVPNALVGVLFPAFSSNIVKDRKFTVKIYSFGLKVVYVLLFPVLLMVISYAFNGIGFWLGKEFAIKSITVTQWLAAGIFINSVAFVPYSLIQAYGRPDMTAKLHLVEPFIYIPVLLFGISKIGILGAALTWFIRALITTGIILYIAQRLMPEIEEVNRLFSLSLCGSVLVLIGGMYIESGIVKILYNTAVDIIFIILSWKLLFSDYEKEKLKEYAVVLKRKLIFV